MRYSSQYLLDCTSQAAQNIEQCIWKRGHLKPGDHCDDFNCLSFHKTKLVISIFPAKVHGRAIRYNFQTAAPECAFKPKFAERLNPHYTNFCGTLPRSMRRFRLEGRHDGASRGFQGTSPRSSNFGLGFGRSWHWANFSPNFACKKAKEPSLAFKQYIDNQIIIDKIS